MPSGVVGGFGHRPRLTRSAGILGSRSHSAKHTGRKGADAVAQVDVKQLDITKTNIAVQELIEVTENPCHRYLRQAFDDGLLPASARVAA